MSRVGLLLINLGTPDSPQAGDVRRYLDQFLMDPRVLDIGAVQRAALVKLLILPRRPKASGEAYAKIWGERGSPLLVNSLDLRDKVQAKLGDGVLVELAMRYGAPAIPDVLERMRRAGVDRIVAFPLYPQYASSSTGSSVQALFEAGGADWNTPYLQVVPPFYDHPSFIAAFANNGRRAMREIDAERVIFSFHGLPERHCIKSDDSGSHCLRSPDCCEQISIANRNCYRAQCFATARLIGDALSVPEARRVICFQSRLGRDPWIKPYTDQVIVELAKQGVRRALIFSPAFVADCLETLEELGMRAAEDFAHAGGERLLLVPSLNAEDHWVDAVIDIARQSSGWLRDAAV
ncbi:MAG: ferrochelatase [Myxococcales bacterium]|nr:ferrochelatase [Myxococcales bacterium]